MLPVGIDAPLRGFSLFAACKVLKYVLVKGRFSGLFSLLSVFDNLQAAEFLFESSSLVFPLLRYVALFLLRDSENLDFSTPFFVLDTELSGIFRIPEKEAYKCRKYAS